MPRFKEDEISLLDVHDGILNLTNVVTNHIEEEDRSRALIIQQLDENRRHTNQVQEHFDKRIVQIKDEVGEVMLINHFTKDESREEVTKAIVASEKRLWGKVKLIGWVIGVFSAIVAFLSKYGHLILALMGEGKNGT